MSRTDEPRAKRVGALRPNQLLHTYGVGAVADLPNLSVVMMGLDHWDLQRASEVAEPRLLVAARARLGEQVSALRQPPHLPETPDVFAEWARTGVPVGLFPGWLRCSDTRCNRLAPVSVDRNFELLPHAFAPDKIRYVHNCRGNGPNRPVAVPARFVLACGNGHLDDFPWQYFAHGGVEPVEAHVLTLTESGSTGEAANIFVTCECGRRRAMSDAFGKVAERSLPQCRGKHPHLATYEDCAATTRTLALGATNTWFSMLLRVFSLPRASDPVDHIVAEHWDALSLLLPLPDEHAVAVMRTQKAWSELEPYGADKALRAVRDRADALAHGETDDTPADEVDLLGPEWTEFTGAAERDLPDFTTRHETRPRGTAGWLDRVVLVPRLREVSALYGFTRIDAPEWGELDGADHRRAPLSEAAPTWLPCAELRGEGFFLQFTEQRIAQWERGSACRERESELIPAHRRWREQRGLDPEHWPGLRYLLLHTFAHALIRELALESGYSAAGIGERIYAKDGMAGILLYTAAPDSEGTLGGLVSLGDKANLGGLLERAIASARLCSSDPLCAEHDPKVHGRLYGAACHACLFGAETSCERGNQYLDRALLVDTIAGSACGFFG